MNTKCYKLIFSKRLNTIVVVGENASSVSHASNTSSTQHQRIAAPQCASLSARYLAKLSTFAAAALLSFGGSVVSVAAPATNALPTGGSVAHGQVAISQAANTMTVNQTSNQAIVNWNSFNIGAQAAVNIVQPSVNSVHLSRVVGSTPSQIFGQLTSNGQVVLVNPNGIVFGKDGSVSAASFTASTLGITDENFKNGNYRYTRDGATGTITNDGKIQSASGGYVALLGAQVTNNGQIIAPQGAAYLGAAEAITVPVSSSGRIKLELTPAAINTAVSNSATGTIVSESGQVYLQASALNDAAASAVSNVTNSGAIDVSGAQAGNVTLLTDHGNIKANGSINANSTDTNNQGGNIIIGRDVDTGILAAATDASGAKLEAKGGFVETSGDHLKTDGITVHAKDWLLDPANITISSAADTDVTGTSPSNITPTSGSATSVVNVSTIQNAINAGTNVTITTTNTGTAGSGVGNITIADALTFDNTGSADATFKLIADNGIFVNAGITGTGSKLVHIDMLAKGFPGGVPIAVGNSDNRSNGISVGNVAINTNGSLKMDGSSFNDLSDRRGINFASGARITAASFNIHGKAYTAGVANHGVKINSNNSFTSTSSSVTSVINGSSRSSITGVTAGTDINGTGNSFNALNGSTIVIKGSNPVSGLGLRISSAGDNTTITTNGNVTFGALDAGFNFSMRAGTITANSGRLSILGETVSNFGGESLIANNGASIYIEGKNLAGNTNNGVNFNGISIKALKGTAAVAGDLEIQGQAGTGVGVAIGRTSVIEANNVIINGISASSAGVRLGSIESSVGYGMSIAAGGNIDVTGLGLTGMELVHSTSISANNVRMIGNAVTAATNQFGAGIQFQRFPTAATITARTGDAFLEGSVSGPGTGSGIRTLGSGTNGTSPAITATAGDVTIRGNNRATTNNTSAAISADSGFQVKAGGNIVLQAETNNAAALAMNFTSSGSVGTGGNLGLEATGDVLIQSNQGSISFNNQQASTAGKTTDISGRNITVDNTGAGMATGAGSLIGSGGTTGAAIGSGSIDLAGAITAGLGKATGSGTAGINFADNRLVRASGNLNIMGAATSGNGVGSMARLTGGAVNLKGSSATGGGVLIQEAVTATTGNITLQGDTTATNLSAITLSQSATGRWGSLNTTNKDIHIIGNTMSLGSGSAVNAGTGTVRIRTSTPGNEILLGGTSSNDVMSATLSSQKLGIDNAELNTITAGNIVIGDTASAGLITVSAPTTILAQTGNITLQTGGNIAVNANLTIADANQLTLDAAGANSTVTQSAAIQTTGLRLLGSAVDYSLTNTSNAIGTLAANAKSVSLYSSNALTVGSVAGTSGITSDNGIVSLSSAQAIGGTGDITSGTGAVTFNTASGTGNYNGVITSTGSFTKAGAGTTVLSADHVRTGDTFITGGTLQVGDGGTTGNLGTGSVSLSNGAALVIDRSDSINLSNSIGGQGNLYAESSGGSLTLSNLSINKAVDGRGGNIALLAAGDVSMTNSGNIRLSAQTTANNGNINITNSGGTLTVDSVNGINGVTSHGSGNISLTGTTNSGYGLYLFGNVTALGGNIAITGSSSASTSGLTTPDAGVRSAGVVSAKNINLVANATNTSGAVLGFYGAEGSLIASEQLTLSGSSANSGNGFYNIAGTMTAGTGITVTGTSANGQGVGFDANVRLTNTAGDVVITGTANGSNTQAIGLRGSRITNSNGVTRLVAAKGNLVSASVNGAGGNWGVEPVGQPLLNIISHSGTGAVEVTAGTLATDAGAIDGKALTINQSGNGGVLVKTSGTGNVIAPKIINTGTGDVVVAAGASLAAGDATGGQVLTQPGNSISSGGKTSIYSGSVVGTGNLSVVDSSFSNLALAGSGLTPNAQLNSAFGDTISGGANTQVLFRQSALPNAFNLSLSNISKEYGSTDLTGSALISALSAAYAANSGASTLTKVTGNNTFAMLASTAFDGLNVSAATRTAGENVNSGTPYAYSGMTNNNAIVAVGQPGLVITPKALSITANAISGTYSGATYDALATAAGFTSDGLVNATINGVAINDSISAVESTFKMGSTVGSGTTITGSGVAQVGDFNRAITNASGTGLANYTISYTGNTGSIAKANLSATGTMVYDASTTFNGASFTSIAGVNGETFTATGSGTLASANVQVNQNLSSVGSLILTGVNGALTSNYNDLSTNQTSVSVTPATLTVTGVTNTVTYNGLAQSNSGASYSGQKGTDAFLISGYASGTNADTYNDNLSVSGTALANYTVNYTNGKLIIGKADLSATGTMVYDASTTFNGASFTSIAGVNGETFTASGSGTLASSNVQTNQNLASVGSLSLTGANGALASNYNALSTNQTFVSVTPAPLTVTGANTVTTYTGLAQTNAAATVTGKQGTDSFVISGYGSGINAGTYADSLTVTAGAGTSLSNYTLSNVAGSLVIDKAPITIALDNKTTTYGSITPLTFSVSGLVNGETATTAGISIAPRTTGYITAASTTNNVGNYAITTATIPDNANYIVTSVTDGNLNITPATLTFTVQDASKLVTKADPTLSYSVSGLVNGDTASAYTAPSISRASGETAGTYAMSLADGSAQNYTIVKNNGTFEIVGAQKLLITMAGATTTYGTLGASVITSAQYLDADLVTFYTLSNTGNNVWSDGVGGTITITPTLRGVSVNSNVGTYANAVTNSNTGIATSANNFLRVVTQEGNYVVNPAALTISANNITRTYDGSTFSVGSATAPNATATGFMNGEGFGTLGGLSFTGAAVDSRNAGTYTYNATANSNPNGNYSITYQSGTLITNKANLTISANTDTRVFDGTTASAVAVSTSTLGAGDTISNLSQSYTSKDVLGTNGSTLNVNAGYIINDGNSGNNYNTATLVSATGSITPASLAISALTETKTYDGTTSANATPLLTSGTLYGSDTVTATGQAYQSKNVLGANGSTLVANAVTVSDGNNGANYTVSYQTAQGTITPLNLSISGISAENKVYDGTTAATINTQNIVYTGLIAGDVVNTSATGSFDTPAVGTNKAVALSVTNVGSDVANYTISNQAIAYADITAKPTPPAPPTPINPETTSMTGVIPDVNLINPINVPSSSEGSTTVTVQSGSFGVASLDESQTCTSKLQCGCDSTATRGVEICYSLDSKIRVTELLINNL